MESLPKKEAKLKAARFCAYQERTQQQVREKLQKILFDEDLIEEIIAELITENFISEERFAKSFTSGKFRLKKWGRNKILMHLKQKGLTDYCIREGMKEIDEEVYQEQIRELILKKYDSLNSNNSFQKKDKVSKYLIGRGYEPELVWKNLDDLYPR